MAKTLRDEFAMAAMAGRLANGLPANPRYCYTIAAGMLEERKKQMAAENEQRHGRRWVGQGEGGE